MYICGQSDTGCRHTAFTQHLVGWLKQVKELLRKFEETQVHHIPREANKEADLLANQSLEGVVIGVVKF